MRSLWQSQADLPTFPQLTGEISTDVLVIGGGMAGLLISYCLQQRGINVALVEKDRLCGGTTAHTTAKITAQHGLVYHKILRSYGFEHGEMYYRANADAVEKLKQLCRQANSCLETKANFVYSADPKKLEKELAALEKLGLSPRYENQLPVPVQAAGAVGLENQGQFDPLALAAFLAKGLRIIEHTKVQEMVGTTAITELGRIRAKNVVVATHFPFINKHGSYFLKLYQHRSYLLACKNVPPLPAMYVDDSHSGFSLSSFDDYLLLGGGGHRTGQAGGGYSQLRAFQKQNFPQAQECFHWGAQDTMSLDGIPYIGRYSKNTPHLFVAAGFNKWGMTGSMVSAQLLSAMIAGESPDYAPVFSPSRSVLKPQLFVNGFETTKNLLRPAAPRCPHLGCALKYNPQEHSWDCACHGSRFSETGKVLNNPANNDLKR